MPTLLSARDGLIRELQGWGRSIRGGLCFRGWKSWACPNCICPPWCPPVPGGLESYLDQVIERKVWRWDSMRSDLREEGSSKLGVRSKCHPEELHIHLLSSVSLLNNLQQKKHRNPLAQMIFWHSLSQRPTSLFLRRGARPTKPAGGRERGCWAQWAFFGF